MSKTSANSIIYSHASAERRASAAAAVSGAPTLDRTPFRWTQRDRTSLPVEVEGQVPEWLRGKLMRTAPAVFAKGAFRAAHLFDGRGILYAFSFAEQVTFKQRLLASRALEDASRERPELASFGTPAKRTILQRLLKPVPLLTDNANVNVVPWQGQWLAMTEAPYQHVIASESLGSQGIYRYEDELPETFPMTAHPLFDFESNAMVNVGMTFGARPALHVFRQEANSKRRVVEGSLKLPRLPYMHAFGLTAKSAVLIDHPFTFNPAKGLFSNRGVIDHYRWQPERGTRLYKLDRATGAFTEYETEPLFCFHTVNTFEDGADVVMDFLAYDDPAVVSGLKTEALMGGALPSLAPRFVRARLRPGQRHVELEQLSSEGFEFPNINFRTHNGKPYGNAWGAALEADGNTWRNKLVRIDLEGGSVTRFSEPDMIYGEPVFVPNPSSGSEARGVLLSVGSHLRTERSSLVVLDAERMEPLAHCNVELTIPLGFHGNFRGTSGG